MIDILWDLYQQRRINEVDDKAGNAGRKATDFQHRVRLLEEQVDRLALVNLAMWHLLRERAKLTDEHLAAKVREIDLLDGVEDGKLTRAAAQCPRCNRTLSARHKRCLYCGHDLKTGSPFDGV